MTGLGCLPASVKAAFYHQFSFAVPVAIDWVQKKTMKDQGIYWFGGNKLSDIKDSLMICNVVR